ncbi:YfcE family phosphodiesterase [archaeon]|nr:MAG: YfcE family phosphodiesterase [archaeon]
MRVLAITDLHGTTLDNAESIADDYDLILIGGDITHFGRYDDAKEILSEFIRDRAVCAVYGNCDYADVDDYLREADISVHGRRRDVGPCTITGFSGAPKSPFNTPGEVDDEEIGAGIRDVTSECSIVLTHAPPFETAVDMAPVGHVGSKSLHEYILREQPAINICGHIHEARGTDRIGSTLIVNPGPYFKGYYAHIDIGGDISCELRSF